MRGWALTSGGSAEDECLNEDFLPANDEATSHVVFITHELPKNRHGFIEISPHFPQSTLNLSQWRLITPVCSW